MPTSILSMRAHKNRFFCLLFLLPLMLAALLSAKGAKPRGPSSLYMVFGIDERQIFPLQEKPWFSIGRVEVELPNQTWGNCTGTLIDRDLVLTGAHCLVVKGTERGSNVWFRAGVEGATKRGEARVVQKWVGTVWPDEHREDDWAVLRLDRPLGERTGWLPLAPQLIGEGKGVTIVGYADDFRGGRMLATQSNCSFRWRDKFFGYFLHDCDMNSGTSGAPMFMFQGTKPYIVALNVAHTTQFPIFHAAAFSEKDANVAVDLFKASALIQNLNGGLVAKEKDGLKSPPLALSSQVP